jgi:uncharacterized protein YbjQ (UPF0145 family)
MGQTRILAAIVLAALAAPPALAQQAKASAPGGAGIIVTEANLPDAYTALGAVSVNVHPKSMNPKTPTRDLLDDALRREAAKLGADAVVQVRYTMRNPMMSQKGSDAVGVAVKFTGTAAAALPAPAPAPTPTPAPAPAPQAVATPPAAVQPPAPQIAPQVAASSPALSAPAAPPVAAAPAPPPQFAAATPAPLPPASPAPAPAAVEARHATSADMIVLTDADLPGRRYARVGEVRSEVHQKSMFPKTPSRSLLDADLKAQALKLGADAVILVKYDMHNALTSTKGDIAAGVAVRFE